MVSNPKTSWLLDISCGFVPSRFTSKVHRTSTTYPSAICVPVINVALTAAGHFLDPALNNVLPIDMSTSRTKKYSAWTG